jgi:hypothetical protein
VVAFLDILCNGYIEISLSPSIVFENAWHSWKVRLVLTSERLLRDTGRFVDHYLQSVMTTASGYLLFDRVKKRVV